MPDRERGQRTAGVDGGTRALEESEEHQPGLLSAAHLARLREAAERGSQPAPADVVVLVSSANVAPDRGEGARIYVTLDIGTRTGVIPGRAGQLMVDGALLSGGRFEIERVSETECVASLAIEDGAAARILHGLSDGTLKAVIFGASRPPAGRPH